MKTLFSSSCEYLQDPSVSPKSYLDSRGHVGVVQVEGPNKTKLKLCHYRFSPL